MKSIINQFLLLSLLSVLLTSCGKTKNVTPNSLFKQIGSSPQAYTNTEYREVYVLGDSLSDMGGLIGVLNNILSFAQQEFHTLKWVKRIYFPSPFYNGKSFSNGPVTVEYVAKGLGLSMTPGWSFSITPQFTQWLAEQKSAELSIPVKDILQGVRTQNANTLKSVNTLYDQVGINYAVADSRASFDSSLPYILLFNQFQLKNQLKTLIKHHPDIGSKDLFIIIIGGNDVKTAVFDKNPAKVISESISDIFKVLNLLAEKNIKHIVLGNVPDIGITPFTRSKGKQALATQLSNDFNRKLSDEAENFRKMHPEINLKILDIHGKMQSIIADYQQKGNNTSDACIADITTNRGPKMLLELLLTGRLPADYLPPCNECNISNHIFFDDFHPTIFVNKVIGDTLFDLVVTNNDL